MSDNPTPPAYSVLRAKAAAHASWARTEDRTARTQAARQGIQNRFERQVDPDRTLDPAERARRADHARMAHMLSMALKSAKARRLRAQAARIEAEVGSEDLAPAEEIEQLGGDR